MHKQQQQQESTFVSSSFSFLPPHVINALHQCTHIEVTMMFEGFRQMLGRRIESTEDKDLVRLKGKVELTREIEGLLIQELDRHKKPIAAQNQQ